MGLEFWPDFLGICVSCLMAHPPHQQKAFQLACPFVPGFVFLLIC